MARCQPGLTPPRPAVLLIRRGGYAVALAEQPCDSGSTRQVPDRVLASKVGTRYVQSRTAAGGWSQQRFARRRQNQADGLVAVAAATLARLITEQPGEPDSLVTGGDRALVAAVLTDPRLRALSALPRRELPDLGDPRAATIPLALGRARAWRITLTEPDPG